MPSALLTPIADDATRRQFLTALTAAGLLAGCGAGAETAAVPPGDGYPRTVVDDAGVAVELPARPERVTITDPFAAVEALLAIGVVPVQVGVRPFTDEFTGERLGLFPWQKAAIEALGGSTERIELADSVNLEAVAASRPDVVIGAEFAIETGADALAALAPTLRVPFDFAGAVTIVGAALGLEDRAAAAITTYDQRLSRDFTGLVPDGTPIAIIRYDGEPTVVVYDEPGFGAGEVDLLLRAGFAPVPGLPGVLDAGGRTTISLEQLDLLAPAAVVVANLFTEGNAAELMANPLFAALPAVAAGRVVVIEQGLVAQAFASLSPLSLDTVLPVIREAAHLAS